MIRKRALKSVWDLIWILQKWHEDLISNRFSVSIIKFKKFNRSTKIRGYCLGVRNYSTSTRNTNLKELSKGGS